MLQQWAQRGVYAITPDEPNDERLIQQVTDAIRGGIRILQYRNSTADDATRHRQAHKIAEYCREHAVCFIINNNVSLALECNADGVHLGKDDTPIAQARQQLGTNKIIGATCHNSLERAQIAQQDGANYIGVGALYPSSSKPTAPRCSLLELNQIKKNIDLPIVGIGGITLDNTPEVIAAGANYVAVIHNLFSAPDIAQRARDFSQCFDAM